MNNINDPVWSVIIMIAIGLACTGYVIYYILKLATEEMKKED